jgi:hypothetical protein
MIVTPAEIAAARADFATMLPDRCTIQRAVEASDGGGGQTTTWPDIAVDVSCRLTPAQAGGSSGRAASGFAGDRLNDQTTHIVTFAAGFDVQQADRIVITGTAYEILGVGTGGEWELARHVEVRPVP